MRDPMCWRDEMGVRQQMVELFDVYIARLTEMGIVAADLPDPKTRVERLSLAAEACVQARAELLSDSDDERATNIQAVGLLGLVQGILLCCGVYSMPELAAHVRPPNIGGD